MRVCLVLAALALASFLLPASGAAAFCNPHSLPPGTTACLNNPVDPTCNQLGETTADSDSVNLIACLKKSQADPTPVWKSMSSGGGSGCPSGFVMGTTPVITDTGLAGAGTGAEGWNWTTSVTMYGCIQH